MNYKIEGAIRRNRGNLIIFLIPTLVSLVFNLIGNIGLDTVDNSETGNFFQCWGLNSKNKNKVRNVVYKIKKMTFFKK